jgi:hypothetical protein
MGTRINFTPFSARKIGFLAMKRKTRLKFFKKFGFDDESCGQLGFFRVERAAMFY